MQRCTKHPHSSVESAEECYMRSVDRRIKIATKYYNPIYVQELHSPPKSHLLGSIEIFYFASAAIV